MEPRRVQDTLVSPATPSCTHCVVAIVASSRSEDAAVAVEYLPFLYGWEPTADHWEFPTAINSGSTANAVLFYNIGWNVKHVSLWFISLSLYRGLP